MGVLGTLLALVSISFSTAEIGSYSDESPSDFEVSIIATVIVNFCVNAALGGVGGYLAEITRGTRDRRPRPPTPPPTQFPDEHYSGEINPPDNDLRDRWK